MTVDRRLLALATVGLLLTTSGVWLVPNEGETEYTYVRAEVSVTDGEIVYDRPDAEGLNRYNDLAAIDCQPTDEFTRACAFDSYLLENGPVMVPNKSIRIEGYTGQKFVSLEEEYHRRVRRGSENGTYTFDVEEANATAVLDDISQRANSEETASTWVGLQAATEGKVTTLASPETVNGVGQVYRVDGTDYVIVVADRSTIDRVPVPLPDRSFLVGLGLVCLFVAALAVPPFRLGALRKRL